MKLIIDREREVTNFLQISKIRNVIMSNESIVPNSITCHHLTKEGTYIITSTLTT